MCSFPASLSLCEYQASRKSLSWKLRAFSTIVAWSKSILWTNWFAYCATLELLSPTRTALSYYVNLTPDIVCKLSVHEMEMLGIKSQSDMISLRIECTKFGEEAPNKLEGTYGAPRGIYNQGNIFDPCCIREYGLPDDEAIRIEQVRVHWHFR